MFKHHASAAAVVAAALCFMSAASAQAPAAPPTPAPAVASTGGDRLEGLAAYYSNRLSGHKTASGKTYNPEALTAAHPTLPFGTKVKVTNTKNKRSVVVTINDRGPTQPDRVIDVSRAAAEKLGMGRSGTTPVTLEIVSAATNPLR